MLAVITGPSGGMGEAFASRLAAQGWDLIIPARRTLRLDALAEMLRRTDHHQVRVQTASLLEPGALAQLQRLLADEDVDLLVNNAGTLEGRPGG